jgi:2-haloacid dehalogenase
MWVLFDLNGTLVDPSRLAEPLGVDAGFVSAAFDEANAAAMVVTLGGVRAQFKALLESALRRRLAAAGGSDAGLPAALERLSSMPAYPDARAALERLRDAGLELGVLTQSSATAAETVVRGAGLRDLFAFAASAPEGAGAYKPDPRAYRHGLARAGADTAWFVAGHWWDVAGATAAGLRGAWVARTDVAYPSALPQPEAKGADLLAVAEAILTRTAA